MPPIDARLTRAHPGAPRALARAVAEHLVTGHKVAVKILNRAKILALDMGEKVRPRARRVDGTCSHPSAPPHR